MEQLLIDKRQLRGELELRGRLFDYMPIISMINLVDVMPTIDAVEVVRCKDCKWWTKQSDSAQGRCELFHHYPTGGWYCANGRREDETD